MDSAKAVERAFSPEFRNRLDAVIQFNALGIDVIESVVDKFLIKLESQLLDKKVTLIVDDKAKRWLAEKGHDPLMGARPMARVIQENIKRPLADEILFGALSEGGGTVRVTVKKDKLTMSFAKEAVTT